MNYKYEIINYDNDTPAKIMYLNLSSDSHETELHWHREPEIVYVTDGIAECQKNGEKILVRPGQFLLFNSEDVHMVCPKQGTYVKMVLVQLSYEYMRLFNNLIDEITFSFNKKSTAKECMNNTLKEISNIDYENDTYAKFLHISLVNKIYYILFNYCLEHKPQATNPVITQRDFSYAKTAISYINENFRKEITLQEISDLVNLSQSYFSKYFKSVTHINFSDYLANLRLEYAIQDMINKNLNVAEASKNNGFANVKAFITQCKKTYGYTPAQYKKHILNG